MTQSSNLTIYNINKKGIDNECVWSEKDIWKYIEGKEKRLQIVRCGYYDDGRCMDRGLVTFHCLPRHILNGHCGGDESIFNEDSNVSSLSDSKNSLHG